MKNAFPLQLGRLDHYTLIVPDAKACTRFHTEILGFGWVREQLVNAGSAPPGEHDMLNHILHLPGDPSRVVVVTEGLTPESVFRRYLDTYGPGIHHVAYAVDDVEKAFHMLKEVGIPIASDHIVHDPISGLRQVFVCRQSSGYFIELIERTADATDGTFEEGNMAELANTMAAYLWEDEEQNSGQISPQSSSAPVVAQLPVGVDVLRNFLLDLSNLGRWTAHQTLLQRSDGSWIERRLEDDVGVTVEESTPGNIHFSWHVNELAWTVTFELVANGDGTQMSVSLPPGLDVEQRKKGEDALRAEIILLRQELGDDVSVETWRAARDHVARFHVEVYGRS